MSKELLEKAETYQGTEFEIGVFSAADKEYVPTLCRFIDASFLVWKIGEAPTIDLWANIEIVATGRKLQLSLEKFLNAVEGKSIIAGKIKFKEVPLTFKAQTQSVYVGAVPFRDKDTLKVSYKAFKFKKEDGEPQNSNDGTKVSDIIYDRVHFKSSFFKRLI